MKTRIVSHTPSQCLTIAGSDSGGGAGIQADLKSFQANGAFGMSVLTSITAQNTQRVARAYDLPEDLILEQLQAVFEDFTVSAAKTGMLSSKSVVSTISAFWRSLGPEAPPLIVDPVMISRSGYPLLHLDAVARVRKELLPLATLVTPNRHEAELLSGVSLGSREEVEEAGWKILALGPKAVLLKGGHLDGRGLDPARAIDYLFTDGKVIEFSSPRIETDSTHGAGCTLSAAITAWIGRGLPVAEAVARAKKYMDGAIAHALAIGHGHGPTNHFFFMTDWMQVLESAKRSAAAAAAARKPATKAAGTAKRSPKAASKGKRSSARAKPGSPAKGSKSATAGRAKSARPAATGARRPSARPKAAAGRTTPAGRTATARRTAGTSARPTRTVRKATKKTRPGR